MLAKSALTSSLPVACHNVFIALQTVPLSIEGEDEHSIRQHEALLVAESKKTRPRLDLMKTTMTRSVKPRAKKERQP